MGLFRNPPTTCIMAVCIGATVFFLTVFIKTAMKPSPEINVSSSKNSISFYSQDDERLRNIEKMLERLNEKIANQRSLVEELACEKKGIGARGGFCLDTDHVDVGYNYMWDPRLCKNLDILFANQSVGDFGAGLGWYGRWMKRAVEPTFDYGKDIEQKHFLDRKDIIELLKATPQSVRSYHGYDAAGNVEKVTGGFIKYLDLAEEQHLPMKFDWVMSLEVGEHIPHAYEEIFIDNLVRHACKGILLTWAVEGQAGHFHVNNHNNSYVKQVMSEKGFDPVLDWEDKLRSELDLGHFVRTIMVFKRKDPFEHPKCYI